MSRIAALKSLLTTGLSSPPAFTQFSPRPVPINAQFPYVTCVEIGGPDMSNLNGRNGLARKVMQIECWHPDYQQAWECRKRIKDFLCPIGGLGYTGEAGDLYIAGTNHAADREFYDGERELHQLVCSFIIWWDDDAEA